MDQDSSDQNAKTGSRFGGCVIQALTFMAVHLWTIVSGVISLLNGDQAISQLVEMQQVVAAQAPQIEPSGESPSVVQQPTPQIQFDLNRLSDLLARTSNVRATAVEAVEQQKQKQPPAQNPEISESGDGTSKAAASPYLNDAIRQQNELFRQDEQRAKFYESKF